MFFLCSAKLHQHVITSDKGNLPIGYYGDISLREDIIEIRYFSSEGYFEVEDIEEMDVWCKEDTGMQKKLGRDMSGRTRHTKLCSLRIRK